MENCTDPCGSCSDKLRVVDKDIHLEDDFPVSSGPVPENAAAPLGDAALPKKELWRLVFTYSKEGSAPFYPHLSVIDTFCRAFQMAGIPYALSEGFNPMPRLELSQPLPMGARALAEMGNLMLREKPCDAGDLVAIEAIVASINARLPEGLRIANARILPVHEGKKIHTLQSLSWGSEYLVSLARGVAGMDIGQVYVGLRNRIDELGIAGAELELRSETQSIQVILPDPARKEAGLSRLLETVTEERPIQSVFAMTRLRCLAKGRHEVGYRDYVEAIEEVIRAQA